MKTLTALLIYQAIISIRALTNRSTLLSESELLQLSLELFRKETTLVLAVILIRLGEAWKNYRCSHLNKWKQLE